MRLGFAQYVTLRRSIDLCNVRASVGDNGDMSELGTTAATLRPVRFALPAAPIAQPFYEVLATLL